MTITAAIYGLQGTALTPDEKAFFRDAEPWGFILFARNIDGPKGLARLCGSLRDAVGRDCAIFIDQEGGRVQRLTPPTWRKAPPAARFGALWDREPELALEAVRLNHQLIAAELKAVGIDADCAPCCDLAVAGADAVIGDRAFHAEPDPVRAMAGAAIAGLRAEGVAGVIKHVPGHGRADADSHHALPVVREPLEVLHDTDFAAFRGIEGARMAMTAHVVYAAVDPENAATVSREVVETVIRGDLGFDGLLMTDDLSMKALDGTLRRRAAASLAAGCDMLLHCNGDRAEMESVAHEAPALLSKPAERAAAADADRKPGSSLDADSAAARLDALFAEAGLEAAGS